MSIYKPAKSRFFQYDFQYQGRRFHGSTGQETRRAAEEVERRRRRAAALGELDVDDIPTLQQAASAWWTNHAQNLRTADDIWTRIGICQRLIGKDRKVTEIDQDVVARAMLRRSRETYARTEADGARRYPVQPATVNADVFATMRRILRHAAKSQRLRPLLPAIDWKDLKLAEPEPAFRIYSPAQQAAWRAECDDVAGFALELLLRYGLRFGELFFPPAAFHPAEADEPESFPFLLIEKRKRGRMVLPLRADDARLVAARAGRALAAGLDSIWLEQAAGGRLVTVTYDGLYARLKSAGKRAGLDMGRVIHGARHHAASTIVRRTQNLKAGQELLGHANIASTMRYAHMLKKDLHAALERESRNSPEPAEGEAEFSPPKQRRKGTAKPHS